jgi:dTDP-4-dehydrorhamnose 3,5-epimerase-like enzyme
MNIETLSIPGLQLLHLFHSADDRGDFVKTFHAADFQKMNLGFEIKESYYSVSHKNVIRGMHFNCHQVHMTNLFFVRKALL